jgi:hypothetical protein
MWLRGVAGVVGLGVLLFAIATLYDPRPNLRATPVRETSRVDSATLQRSARVILITLDGARWQEVLDENGPLRHTLEAARANGAILSGRTSSRLPKSLPGYQAISGGHETACEDNQCPRISTETLSEGLARRMSLPPEQVATFGSWARLVRSASSRDGTVFVDLPAEGAHPDVPWPNARRDDETIERAMKHWTTVRPRFLHLALLDMDEWAHAREPERMVEALEAADVAIGGVLAQVELLPADERRLTTVIVTTDHGRGFGPMWVDHGPFAAARTIFLLAIGDTVRGGEGEFTQAQIRPTVERLFGGCANGAIEAIAGPSLECI